MGYPNHPKFDHLKIILDNFRIETQGFWDHDIIWIQAPLCWPQLMYVATSWRESVATARTLGIGEMMHEVVGDVGSIQELSGQIITTSLRAHWKS